MSSPTSRPDPAQRRAEARRRARLAARGEITDEPVDDDASPEEPARSGFLTRIFPAAPPLPNRPDPLKGFDDKGSLRPVRVRIFLLRRNLLAWLATGAVAFVGYLASVFWGQSILALLGTFVLFGSLIAAGWFGWQRPTLYGTTASLLAFALVTVFILVTSLQVGVTPEAFGTPGDVAIGLAVQGAYQAGLGFLGGWYGGYLRRRQTQLSADVRRRR